MLRIDSTPCGFSAYLRSRNMESIMAKKPSRSGKRWSVANENYLRSHAETSSTRAIANYLDRTESAVRAKASQLSVTLLPKDPDNT